MDNLWQATFNGFSELFTPRPAHGDDATDHAIDDLVERTNPRLKAIGSYRRVLRPPMQRAHDYVSGLVQQIPGPTEICADSFSRDPLVNALFVYVDDLHHVFSDSDVLRDFFAAPENVDSRECLALLCMRCQEKTVFGIEMKDDRLRRDVPQTLVSFEDHQVLTPAQKEADLRQGLHRCITGRLIDNAHEQTLGELQQHRQLHEQKRMLHARLRAQEHRDGHRRDDGDADHTRRQLAVIDTQVNSLDPGLSQLEGQLRILATKLDQARDQIHIRHRQMRLSHSHVKLDPKHDRRGAMLAFSEVSLGSEPPRVVTLARYPRREVIAPTRLRLQ